MDLKFESSLEPDIKGFNALLDTLMSFKMTGLAIECFYLMKSVGCEPDRLTFRLLIKGLESDGETMLHCFCIRIIKTADDLESYQLEHCIQSRFIVEIINKREKMIDGEAKSSGNIFLRLLVKASNYADDRNRITVDDVVDECKTSTLVDMKLRQASLHGQSSFSMNMIISESLRLYTPVETF
ncbi:hypothetical protein RJ640_006983 [Escallonia rubra]|uniref:Pentatricopeptide repeat-containing protein n=1 Tax=Escallonia rubra TaxID=112253 RepID=A0AA88R4U7_9ASTE|nr:hypothetical protein RJ640_006983 [Escallonia rubra]